MCSWMEGYMEGGKGGLMNVKAALRIVHSNKKEISKKNFDEHSKGYSKIGVE